ncbi:hypothetical protein [Brevibacterium samyangense]|uniref:Membrane protein n=1 Tax=Brevibacterium samyangense TaxID=366888 RepID=A0ABN2T3C9_9MICO
MAVTGRGSTPAGRVDFRLLADAPLPARLLALFGGLFLFGVSAGLMIVASLGNMPWDVLHEGIARHLPLSIGTIGIIVSVLLLLLWIPLRQKPGLGTLSNALLVGLFIDLTMHWVRTPPELWQQILLMLGALLLNGLATVLYIAPDFGPGPRDGLMTGLVTLTGRPVFLVRTCIEIVVIAVGWLLGGNFFIASVVYALGIGPVTQVFLRLAYRLWGPKPHPRRETVA